MAVRDLLATGKFFCALALKEHGFPNLHVRPLVAELFLTDNCNLKCVSCACWRSKTANELTTAEWQSVILQLRDLNIIKVNFTGGEPLIRSDAIDLMRFASGTGFKQLHLNTNGIRLTPVRTAAILAAGVRSFNVSIDGPQHVHDQIRGRDGAFDLTIRHLEHLLAHREPYDLKIRLNFTVMRANVEALPAVAELAQKLGVRLYLNLATDKTFLFRDPEVTHQARVQDELLHASLAQLERMARLDRRWLPRYSDLAYIPGHFSDRVQRHLPCAESQLKLMIHSDGAVGGCWAHDATANVRRTRIADVLSAKEYRDEHRRFFKKDCVGCGSNYSLNLRWRPTTYLSDALWRIGFRRIGGS